MKIHILYKFTDGPWGGGNQFLKSIRSYFEKKGVYEDDCTKADIILFNSHHCIKDLIKIKKNFPDKIFIHRVDGPIFLIRGQDKLIDKLIFAVNNLIADGTIFQSNWSRERCIEQGMLKPKYEEVIINAPDSRIFYPPNDRESSFNGRKIRLIATSWSSNMKKGFDIYKYLDENLDFSRHEMTFIGNSPIKFHNINHVEPLSSSQLAEELRRHDIFITASVNDPCSNSLIEALHCGLPAVGRDSGGHPEIIGNSGEVFNGTEDVCKDIDSVAKNYTSFVENVRTISMDEIGAKYYTFTKRIYNDSAEKRYVPKKLPLLKSFGLDLYLKLNGAIYGLVSKLQVLK